MPSERVLRWLNTPVATCPWCDRPVLPTDPRGLDFQDRLCHLPCLEEGAEGPCPMCEQPITRRQQREDTRRGLCHKTCVEQPGRR